MSTYICIVTVSLVAFISGQCVYLHMFRVSEFVVSVIWFDDVYVSLFVAYAFHIIKLGS